MSINIYADSLVAWAEYLEEALGQGKSKGDHIILLPAEVEVLAAALRRGAAEIEGN